MSSSYPQISVIIPTLNGGALFGELLMSLRKQTQAIAEIIVVDSHSDDATCEVAREFGATVLSIAREDFDHGATRTLAAKKASGELLLFFTQDAVPADLTLIENLAAPLLADSQVAISYGRQLPATGASLAATALRHFNYPTHSRTRSFADREKYGLKTAFVSNSCACYRKSCLAEVGYFPEDLLFGEDTCVAGKLLMQGFSIAYVADPGVFHSHNYSLGQELNRSFDIGVLHAIEHWLPDTFGRAEGEGVKYIRFELGMIIKQRQFQLLPLFFCRNLMKFIGYKLGSKYDILPQWLRLRLTMNTHWWQRRNRSKK
jgi:rhamnosyltransferase